MDDLISRQAALRTDCFGDGHEGLRAFHVYEDYKKMRKYIENLPAVQPQPEIVRCKDCKYWMRENISDGYCSEMNIGGCDEDFYCGYAEVHTMEEFMDGQDMGNPEDGSL